MKTDILFLDFDGVLNNGSNGHFQNINYDNVLPLNSVFYLYKKNPISIVISSSWRVSYSLEEIKNTLNENGFVFNNKIIGTTPFVKTANYCSGHYIDKRKDEIAEWLDSNKEIVNNFIILDDIKPEMFGQYESYVYHINPNKGLRFSDVTKILKKLNDYTAE